MLEGAQKPNQKPSREEVDKLDRCRKKIKSVDEDFDGIVPRVIYDNEILQSEKDALTQ